MREIIAAVFALALAASGCSDEMASLSPSEPDNPLNVSGAWTYEARVIKGDCNPSFCSECHGRDAGAVVYYPFITGVRIIEQVGEELITSDHIINEAMGVEMHGTIHVYGGDFLCGDQFVDVSGTTVTITEDGKFDSNDYYTSTLSLSSSRNGTILCKVIWSITGRRAD
ncbi:hypothetical protein N9903_00160 [bacterium]|nr:hypothetical protein [bacterium]